MPARIRADFRRRNPPARRLQAFLPIEGMSLIGGTFETPPDVRYTAAFGGNPDIGEHRLRAEFDPNSDMGRTLQQAVLSTHQSRYHAVSLAKVWT
jgi:hypothetical protein